MPRLLVLVVLIAAAAGATTVIRNNSAAEPKQPAAQQSIVKPTNGPLVTPVKPALNVTPIQPKPQPQPVTPVAPVAPPVQPTPAPPVPQQVVTTQLYDFWSPACGHCMAMKPTIHALEQSGAQVSEIDTSTKDGEALADKMKVHDLPTYIVVQNGKEIKRLEGEQSLADLQRAMGRIQQGVASVKGGNGYRIRLLYPEGNPLAADIKREFDGPSALHDFGVANGYQAISTSDPMFSFWYDNGFKHVEEPVLVMADSQNNIILRENVRNLGQNYQVVLATLQMAMQPRSQDSRYADHDGWHHVGGDL